MKKNLAGSIGAMILVAMLAMPTSLPAQNYKLIDLGTLGGPNSYLPMLPPYHEFLPAASVSRNGTFAGFADTDIPDPYAPLCFNADCYVSHAVAWKHETVTDLGALPGAPGSSSAVAWISENGLIVGMSLNGDIDPLIGSPSIFAVLWKNGQIRNLGTMENGYESAALAVNSAGQVVGLASNNIPDANSLLGVNAQTRAFLWQNGVMHDIGTLPGGTDAMALFINDRGQIVGQSYSSNSVVPPAFGCDDPPLTLYGFFWDKGNMTDLGTLGGSCTFPYSLNNRGEVVGQSNLQGDTKSHPFLWRPGKQMKDLGALGGNYGFAEWLNDAGTVVGSATNKGDQALLAFQWRDDAMTNLGALEGNACSAADAINSQGLVVGGSGFNDAASFPACTDAVEHAVMWDHGRIVDLNRFVPQGYDLTLNEAFYINDDGEIGGVGTLSNGNQHTFLLVPCEEGEGPQGACGDNPAGVTTLINGPMSGNTPIRQVHRLGTRIGSHIPSSGNNNRKPIRDSQSSGVEDKTVDYFKDRLADSPLTDISKARRCLRKGMECPPQFPPCCPGLVCVPASTRAFCE